MRVFIFTHGMGIGGTEKAACRWASGLRIRGHAILAASLENGPRSDQLKAAGIDYRTVPNNARQISEVLQSFRPDAIHAHLPGYPSASDVLFDALAMTGRKIPVVQTNIFGRLDNPRDNQFVDFRLFVCWSSCVQAAERAFQSLDRNFFRRNSVAVNPVDPDDGPSEEEIGRFRESLGVKPEEVLLGQLCRPDPIRWSEIPLKAFRQAQRTCGNLKFLIREPPLRVGEQIRNAPDANRFLILPVTSCVQELRLTEASLDIVLHYSQIGESFGYGIAEPMNLGKPAIVNFAPWNNLGPLELVRHLDGGFAVTNLRDLVQAVVTLGSDRELRRKMGEGARRHIRQLADPQISLNRLENALLAAVGNHDNPLVEEDLRLAAAARDYLDQHRFGRTWRERLALRPFYWRVRFHEWRQRFGFARKPVFR